MRHLFRRLRLRFGERPRAAADIFLRQREDFSRALFSIKTVYLLTMLVPVAFWNALQELQATGLPAPLWPARFLLAIAEPELVTTACLFAGVAGFLWVLSAPGSRAARIFSLAGNVLIVSLLFSRGKIYHTLHAMLWMQFVFVFLPKWKGDGARLGRRDRQSVLVTFAAAQGLLLLFYSLSGIAKIADGIRYLVAGGIGSFSPFAMSYQIAYHLASQYQTPTPAQTFAMEHPYLGFPAYLFIIYLQATALWIVFKPSLHRAWGLGLILFHLGTKLFMGILFMENTLLIGVLLIGSPFHRDRPWRERLRELPVVDLFRRARAQ